MIPIKPYPFNRDRIKREGFFLEQPIPFGNPADTSALKKGGKTRRKKKQTRRDGITQIQKVNIKIGPEMLRELKKEQKDDRALLMKATEGMYKPFSTGQQPYIRLETPHRNLINPPSVITPQVQNGQINPSAVSIPIQLPKPITISPKDLQPPSSDTITKQDTDPNDLQKQNIRQQTIRALPTPSGDTFFFDVNRKEPPEDDGKYNEEQEEQKPQTKEEDILDEAGMLVEAGEQQPKLHKESDKIELSKEELQALLSLFEITGYSGVKDKDILEEALNETDPYIIELALRLKFPFGVRRNFPRQKGQRLADVVFREYMKPSQASSSRQGRDRERDKPDNPLFKKNTFFDEEYLL